MTLLNEASEKYKSNLKAQLAEQASSEDPVERAWAAYAERVSNSWMSPVMPVREGASLTIFHSDGLDESQKRMVVAGLGIAAGMLLPALTSARQAAQRNVATNNLRQIVLGLLNHESAKGAMPAHAIYGADGKPLLSWRVQILPFLGQQELYQQFHLDEPWDSEHNKTLIAQMPDVYTTPGVQIEPGKTNLLAVVGKECFMDGTETGISIRDITDGTSLTVSVVEADPAQAVEWTKPDDLEFNPDDPKAGLGNVRPGGWNVAFCDGSVQFFAEGIDPTLLKSMFTRNGGEAVNRQMIAAPQQAPAVIAPQ
jgi:prepilin-type processing-associated H-X9-DG protein